MKPAILLTESEKDSLRSFMRVESPLTSYARSCRGDASNPDDSKAALEDKGVNKPASLLEGIDLDELPDSVRALLTEKDKSFAILQTEKTTLEAGKTNAEKLARDHQSRADRAYAKLQQHNLTDDNRQQQQQLTPELAFQQTMLDKLVAEGMDAKTALPYAKMLASANSVSTANIQNQLGAYLNPLVQSMGDLASDRVLEKAMHEDKAGILTIPEVLATVQKDIADFNKAGTPVNSLTVENLVKMAYGDYVMKNPNKPLPSPVNIQTRQGFPGSTYAPTLPNTRVAGQAPQSANPETKAAVDQVFAKMMVGMSKKGGK